MKNLTLIIAVLWALGLGACQMVDRDDPLTSLNKEAPLIKYSEKGAVPGQYIVVLKERAFDTQALKSASNFDARIEAMESAVSDFLAEKNIPGSAIRKVYAEDFRGMTVRVSEDQLQRIAGDNRVDFIEQDRVMSLGVTPFVKPPVNPTNATGSNQNIASYGVARVGGPGSTLPAGKAWVIDTGIDLDHPDLNVDLVKSQNFCTQGTFGTDGNDGHGHGTHVAGIIGAKNDSIGTYGVAPNVQLVSIKVLSDEGDGLVSDVIAGLNYVATEAAAADVVNLSLGTPVSAALDSAVQNCQTQSGAAIVIAAGNSSEDADLYSPARVNGTDIYTIGSIDDQDIFSSFSNFGSPVDFVAPGGNIMSTWHSGGYASISGTSMAAPHASGVLLHNRTPNSNGLSSGDPDGGHLIIYR